jgi:hypothetical protein
MKTYTISKKEEEKNRKKTINEFLNLKARFLAPKMTVTA